MGFVRIAALALSAASCLGCLAHRGAADEGLTLVLQDGQRPPAVVYVDRGRMRIETEHESMIIDVAAPRLLSIDGDARTFVESDKKELEVMKASIDQMGASMRADFQKTTKGLSAEQREKMMAETGFGNEGDALDLTFEPMGETRSINGIACEMYRGLVGGRAWEEDCISPWGAGLFRKEDFAALATFWKECLAPPGPGASVWPLLDFYPGFPIARWRQPAVAEDLFGTRPPPEEVKSIKRGAIPTSMFEAPAGFTKAPAK